MKGNIDGGKFGEFTTKSGEFVEFVKLALYYARKRQAKQYSSYWCMCMWNDACCTKDVYIAILITNITRPVNAIMGSMQ